MGSTPPRRLTLKRSARATDDRTVPSYEPEVIERFAAQLERRARAVRRGVTVAGGVLGAIFGSIPLTPLGSAWPIPHVFGFTTLLVGACIGAFIGWVVGDGRAEMYRLHAQTTLCQLHAQRTSLAIWRLLQERPADQRVAAVAATEPEPEPEPDFDFDFDAAEPDTEIYSPAELEAEPALTPATRLVAAPSAYEPALAQAPTVREPAAAPPSLLPDPLPPQIFQPPLSVPAPEPPAPEQPAAPAPHEAPPASVPLSVQAPVPFLRPAAAAQPPVSPPPVSG
jgi:hypothetical protein